MVDLTSEMAALWAALGPGSARRGRVIQFVAAASGEGTSTVAREFARLAAVRARKPVWLIDGDLRQPSQLEAASAEPERFGQLGDPVFASPDDSAFFSVNPPVRAKDGRSIPPARRLAGGFGSPSSAPKPCAPARRSSPRRTRPTGRRCGAMRRRW
jgi:hypothetical protein